ncbi:MAG: DUF2845 domain-containing protein [Chromatiales bacterium]|nr:DUF2845 domain-containing protein [Chromatiales bacterium]
MLRRLGSVAGVWLALVLASPQAVALRCGTSLINVGDSRAEVLALCGEPAYRYEREVELILILGSAVERSRFLTVEEWLYNFGPNRFMVLMTFEADELRHIDRRGYGYSPGLASDPSCAGSGVRLGDTEGEVLLRCGEPDERDGYKETVSVQLDPLRKRREPVWVSEWVYHGGSTGLARLLVFRNNRLAEMRRADERDD